MDNLKGGQQFFSNYLKAFADTVDKQTEIVNQLAEIYIRLNDAVPKFAVESDTIQEEDNESTSVVGSGPIIKNIKLFVSGKIRIKIVATQGGPISSNITLKQNGVNVNSTGPFKSNGNFTFDIPVEEGDVILLTSEGSGSGNTTTISNLKICYDLSTKPGVVIGG